MSVFEIQVYQHGTLSSRLPLSQRPVIVGPAPGSDLVLQTDAQHRALLWREGAAAWIRPLSGAVRVGGEPITEPTPLTGPSAWLGPSVELRIQSKEPIGYPYRAEISLDGIVGPEAQLEDLRTGHRCVVRAEVRVSMLYLLARQLREDTARRLPPADRGWCSDRAVTTGVWGRASAQRRTRGQLHVLVHRVRKDLESGGLSAQCIEKRRGHTRMWIRETVLT